LLDLPEGVSAAGKQQGLLDPRSNLVVEGFKVFDRMPSGSDPQAFCISVSSLQEIVLHSFQKKRLEDVVFRAVWLGQFFGVGQCGRCAVLQTVSKFARKLMLFENVGALLSGQRQCRKLFNFVVEERSYRVGICLES